MPWLAARLTRSAWLRLPLAGHAIPFGLAGGPAPGALRLLPRAWPATRRPALHACSRAAFRVYRSKAARSAPPYGVTNTCCPAVADLSCASQAFAARLAGSGAGCGEPSRKLRQPATPPASYGLGMGGALASRAGTVTPLRRALA